MHAFLGHLSDIWSDIDLAPTAASFFTQKKDENLKASSINERQNATSRLEGKKKTANYFIANFHAFPRF